MANQPKYPIRPMGMGMFANPMASLKRKYRWTFTVDFPAGGEGIPEHFVKSAARPNLEVEELEMNFLHQKWWLPGKGSWQAITVTYYDVAIVTNGLAPLWGWIDTIYQIMDRDGPTGKAVIDRQQASIPGQYQGWGQITMYDGCGTWVEYWDLTDAWPQTINWGELDYSSNDEANIEINLRYSNCQFVPNEKCQGKSKGHCTSCDSDLVKGIGNAARNFTPTSGSYNENSFSGA